MKTIAFILKGYPRVSETFIAQEIHLLERRGFKIEIFSMRQAREPERQPIVEKINAPVTYLPEYLLPALREIVAGNRRALIMHPTRYLSALISALAKSAWTRNRSPIKRFLQAGWLVARKGLGLETSPIGHLHAHFIHAPTELTYYLSRISGLRYSISAHAKDIYTIPLGDVRTRVNGAELLMTCTKYNYNFLRAITGIHADKIHQIYHGIDLEVFRPTGPRTNESLSQIVSVGRLVNKKGYGDILQALRILKDRGLVFTYDIYGTGELKTELLALRTQLGLEKDVTFHGIATQPQIISRFQQGGIFLCGSRLSEDGDRDGIPNTVAEAMSMELPVVATAVSGIPELIEDGKSGVLVPEKNPEALAAAIQDLIANPEKALEIGRNGRARVAQVFDCQTWIRGCAGLLEPFSKDFKQ